MSKSIESVCENCGATIVFGLYWVGSKPCAPRAVWYHPPGNQTCLRKPENWKGKGWPMAEPDPEVTEEFKEHLQAVLEEYDAALRRLAKWPDPTIKD